LWINFPDTGCEKGAEQRLGFSEDWKEIVSDCLENKWGGFLRGGFVL